MTHEEAKILIVGCGLNIEQSKHEEVLNLVLEALEKQIPRTPNFEGDGYDDDGNLIYDTWICPNCEDRYEVDYETHAHCPTCGQSIDWNTCLENGDIS